MNKTHTIKRTGSWITIAISSFVSVFFLLFAVVAKQEADKNAMLAMKNEKKAEQQVQLVKIQIEKLQKELLDCRNKK